MNKRNKHLSIMISEEMREKLEEISKKQERSLSCIAAILIELALEANLFENSRFQ